ncbi:protein kinase domain-containing protein [Effusibacillus lacus]|uniref:Serine/threonine protein kinase n=1 Tax=Effusibacillus lacus TaxID=1348429 RepID=A0A292YL77_9BACL|nr:PASTA domain-containing protein [Effusibacillus lacus]TCS73595.1 protein kinase-like protein [Effusibacillus lacus]GAX89513.1 serine/threonine protein kinase [Effusibacillus lacus]
MDRVFSDRYRLEEQLDETDGAVLFSALDQSFPRKVFITVYSKCDPSFVKLFQSRAQSLAGLSHHHIMSIYDMECIGDTCYLISEYRDCLTLREAIDSDLRFSLEEAMLMSMNIAQAIAHAHQMNVVHGHLTPDSIWLQGRDIKVAFLSPGCFDIWGDAREQDDLLALGKVLKDLFAATPPLYKLEVRSNINEVIDRLLGIREPAYRNAADVAYDLKMIISKDANPLYGGNSGHEEEDTRPYGVTSGEIQALLGTQKKNLIQQSFSKLRSIVMSYFALSMGMLLLGAAASLFMANPDPGTEKLKATIENVPVSVAKAESESSSTITITPTEPIGNLGKGVKATPDLVGLQKASAEQRLLSLGIRYIYYLEPSEYPTGTVFKQLQEPGSQIHPGERVVFYVSSGVQ